MFGKVNGAETIPTQVLKQIEQVHRFAQNVSFFFRKSVKFSIKPALFCSMYWSDNFNPLIPNNL